MKNSEFKKLQVGDIVIVKKREARVMRLPSPISSSYLAKVQYLTSGREVWKRVGQMRLKEGKEGKKENNGKVAE